MPVSARSSVVLPWSMCPAVPMTTVTSDRVERPARRPRAERRRRARLDGPQVEHDAPVLDPPDDRRRRRAGASPSSRVGRPAARSPRPTTQGLAGQRAAADRRARARRPRRRRRAARATRLGPRAQRLGRRRDHPPDRDLGRPPGPARYSPRVAATRGQRHLVGSHRAGQRVAAHPRDQVGPPDDEPGLRPADQLVAAERDDVRAGRQALGRHRLVGQPERGRVEQRARAEVVDDDRAVAMGELGDRRRVGRLGEPGHREVRRDGRAGRRGPGPRPAAPRSPRRGSGWSSRPR